MQQWHPDLHTRWTVVGTLIAVLMSSGACYRYPTVDSEIRITNNRMDPVVVRRLDSATSRERRIEPGETFSAHDSSSHHDPVLGHFRRRVADHSNPSPDVVVGLFALDGTPLGALAFPYLEIIGAKPTWLCTSQAAEPPYRFTFARDVGSRAPCAGRWSSR